MPSWEQEADRQTKWTEIKNRELLSDCGITGKYCKGPNTRTWSTSRRPFRMISEGDIGAGTFPLSGVKERSRGWTLLSQKFSMEGQDGVSWLWVTTTKDEGTWCKWSHTVLLHHHMGRVAGKASILKDIWLPSTEVFKWDQNVRNHS